MDHGVEGVERNPLSTDWNSPPGRPHHTWIRTVESDLVALNNELAMAYRRAQDRQAWSTVVEKDKPRSDVDVEQIAGPMRSRFRTGFTSSYFTAADY